MDTRRQVIVTHTPDRTIAEIQADRLRRWEATPQAQQYRDWFAGWRRRLRILQASTLLEAVLLVAWLVLAWNDSPLAPWVFCAAGLNIIVPIYIIIWSLKEAAK